MICLWSFRFLILSLRNGEGLGVEKTLRQRGLQSGKGLGIVNAALGQKCLRGEGGSGKGGCSEDFGMEFERCGCLGELLGSLNRVTILVRVKF